MTDSPQSRFRRFAASMPEMPSGLLATSDLPDGSIPGMPQMKREPLIVDVPTTLTRIDAQKAFDDAELTNRPSSYKCKACGEKGHNARSKTCGLTPEERTERARVAAKIRSGLRK
jgi:ribosomal protein L37E